MSLHRHAGISLIEVLISLALLSIALLGFDAMTVMSLHASRESYYFSVATNQLQAMADRLRVYGADFHRYAQVERWNVENQQVLPQGLGTVTGSYPVYQITVYWGEWSQYHCQHIQLGPSGCITQQITLRA